MPTNNDIKEFLNSHTAPEASDAFFARVDEAIDSEPIPNKSNVRIVSARRVAPVAAQIAVAASIVGVLLYTQTGNDTTKPDLASPPTVAPTNPTTPTSIETSLVSQVLAKAQQSFADLQGLSATMVDTYAGTDGGGPSTRTLKLRVKANGDYWESVDTGYVHSYDAAQGMATECISLPPCMQWKGVVAGDPQSAPEASYMLLLSRLRSMVTDPQTTLKETTFNGRAGYELSVTTSEKQVFAVSNTDKPVVLTIVVDKETAFPLYGKTVVGGVLSTEITVKDLVVNPTFGAHDFDAGYGKEVKALGGSAANTRVAVGDVKRTSGYDALVPSHVPDGFALAEVSVGNNNYFDGGNPPYMQNVVTLTYRRGLESFTLTTRTKTAKHEWTDPLEAALETESTPASVDNLIDRGTFSGTTAHLISRPQGNHVWGLGQTLVYTVAGDLGPDEMLDVISSM